MLQGLILQRELVFLWEETQKGIHWVSDYIPGKPLPASNWEMENQGKIFSVTTRESFIFAYLNYQCISTTSALQILISS